MLLSDYIYVKELAIVIWRLLIIHRDLSDAEGSYVTSPFRPKAYQTND